MLKGFGYIRFYLLLLILIIFFNNNENKNNNSILKVIYIIFFVILFDALIQFVYGKNLLGFEIINNRVSGIFDEELILGSFILRFLPILLWFMAYNNFDFKRHKFFTMSLLYLSFLVILFLVELLFI